MALMYLHAGGRSVVVCLLTRSILLMTAVDGVLECRSFRTRGSGWSIGIGVEASYDGSVASVYF